jgi:drug/metabolite transporter (DMT)-like permease
VPARALPAALVLAATLCLSVSSTFVRLTGAPATTVAFLRCALALLVLAPLAVWEWRRRGPLSRGACVGSAVAGLFLGLDFTLWTTSILDVGAGVATVLINVQVLVLPLLCRIGDGTPIARRFLACAPLMLAGLAVAGGVLGAPADVANPVRGTVFALVAGVAYAGYLYLNRRSGVRGEPHVVVPVALATAAATLPSMVTGLATGDLQLDLPLTSWAWLGGLALLGQVAPWLLIGTASPRLSPAVVASLLLLQPILALGFGRVVLAETPTAVQLVGCAAVVVAVALASIPRRTGMTATARQLGRV